MDDRIAPAEQDIMAGDAAHHPGVAPDRTGVAPDRTGVAPDRTGVAPDRGVARWLLLLWSFVFLMVAVGGLTRLTGSGLSMVDWRPLMGSLPPLSADAWSEAFGQYQQSPQYQQVNHWMTVGDFKRIFMWEYAHRALGRLVGLLFAIPFAYFLVRRRLSGRAAVVTSIAFLLGGAQGLLGWYMVKSGLVDRPEVSHLRLAAHLSLAFFVGMYLLWLCLSFWPAAAPVRSAGPRSTAPDSVSPVSSAGPPNRPTAGSSWLGGRLLALSSFWTLLGIQVVFGALMAGTHAGLLSSTFPDMQGRYLPGAFFRFDGLLANLVDNPLAIHWTHRALGLAVVVHGVALSCWWLAGPPNRKLRRAIFGLLAALLVQFALGAATAMLGVPTWLAATHQLGAFLLFSAAVVVGHRLRHPVGEQTPF